MTSDAAVMSKPVSRGVAVRAAAEADDDVAQRRGRSCRCSAASVIESGSMPSSLPCRRCASSIAASRLFAARDRVDVAGEVEVQVLHRHDLRVAAAGRAALDRRRPGRARPRAGRATTFLPIAPRPCVRETDVVVLPSPAWVGVIAVTLIELAVRPVGEPVEHGQVDLRLVAAVQLDLVRLEARRCRDLGDGSQGGLLGDLEGRRHRRGHAHPFGRLIDREDTTSILRG